MMHAKMEKCKSHCNSKIVRFMKPLVHGFMNHMSIPESIVNELEWKMESIVLMSEDEPQRHWLILLEGVRHFKSGWKDFCDHHHLSVGDFLVFTHHSYFVFHVSVYDRLTCCQRLFPSPTGSTLYSRFNSINITQTDVVEPAAQVGQQIPPLHPHFSACHITVTSKSRKRSVVYLPRCFITSSGLKNRCCFLTLIDEKDNPWEVKLLYSKYNGYSYFTRGWKNFLISNNIKPRSVLSIQVIKAGRRPILKVSQVSLPPKRVRNRSKG